MFPISVRVRLFFPVWCFLLALLLMAAVNGSAQVHRHLHRFRVLDSDGAYPKAVVRARNGLLYGVTSNGGFYNRGTLFRQEAEGKITLLYHFGTRGEGHYPETLLQGSDGLLYGIATSSGPNGGGSIFRSDLAGRVTIVYSFNYGAGGSFPTTLIEGRDGKLYGATSFGALPAENGSLFRIDRSGANFTVLYNFTQASGYRSTAMVNAADGSMYMANRFGGTAYAGTLLRYSPNGTATVLQSFDGTNGYYPSALTEGTDGAIYGATQYGGLLNGNFNPYGTLFRVDPAGNFTTIHVLNGIQGGNPVSLVTDAGGQLWGAAASGGSAGSGTIFRWTNGVLQAQDSFDDPYAPDTSYRLILGSDRTIYGVSLVGGTRSVGRVFALSSEGIIQPRYAFHFMTDGSFPKSVVEGSDGNLYGVTNSGGEFNLGTVFRIDRSGNFTQMYSLKSGDGVYPQALAEGSDGNLYGATQTRGSGGAGTFFRITKSGQFSVVRAFNYTDYFSPSRLLRAADGRLAIALNSQAGELLAYIGLDGAMTPLFNYGSFITGFGLSALIAAPNGGFYAAAEYGANFAPGVVFAISATGQTQRLYEFSNSNYDVTGSLPVALALSPTGELYGATQFGGSQFRGTLFRFDANGHFQVVNNLGSNTNRSPAQMLFASDQNLYGVSDFEIMRRSQSGTLSRFQPLNPFRQDGFSPTALIEWRGQGLVGTMSGGGELLEVTGGGSSASGPGTVFLQRLTAPNVTDISARVRITSSGLTLDRRSNTFRGTITVRNMSRQPIMGPIQLVIDVPISGGSLVPQVVAPDGSYNNVPFLTVRASLRGGEAVSIPVEIYNPLLSRVSYTVTPYMGEF